MGWTGIELAGRLRGHPRARRQDDRAGHGPITDETGVRDVQRYLRYVADEARRRFEAGMDERAAADDIDISDFRDWGDPERIAVNVATIYRQLDVSLPELSVPELFQRMAEWAARHERKVT